VNAQTLIFPADEDRADDVGDDEDSKEDVM